MLGVRPVLLPLSLPPHTGTRAESPLVLIVSHQPGDSGKEMTVLIWMLALQHLLLCASVSPFCKGGGRCRTLM